MRDRSTIFRSAHEHARRELTWGGRKCTYRKAFSVALRAVYYAEKQAAEKQAAEERANLATLPPVAPEIEQRARELHGMAWGCRIDGLGNERSARFHAEARHLVDTARGLN